MVVEVVVDDLGFDGPTPPPPPASTQSQHNSGTDQPERKRDTRSSQRSNHLLFESRSSHLSQFWNTKPRRAIFLADGRWHPVVLSSKEQENRTVVYPRILGSCLDPREPSACSHFPTTSFHEVACNEYQANFERSWEAADFSERILKVIRTIMSEKTRKRRKRERRKKKKREEEEEKIKRVFAAAAKLDRLLSAVREESDECFPNFNIDKNFFIPAQSSFSLRNNKAALRSASSSSSFSFSFSFPPPFSFSLSPSFKRLTKTSFLDEHPVNNSVEEGCDVVFIFAAVVDDEGGFADDDEEEEEEEEEGDDGG